MSSGLAQSLASNCALGEALCSPTYDASLVCRLLCIAKVQLYGAGWFWHVLTRKVLSGLKSASKIAT